MPDAGHPSISQSRLDHEGRYKLMIRIGCDACGAQENFTDALSARAFFRRHPQRCESSD